MKQVLLRKDTFCYRKRGSRGGSDRNNRRTPLRSCRAASSRFQKGIFQGFLPPKTLVRTLTRPRPDPPQKQSSQRAGEVSRLCSPASTSPDHCQSRKIQELSEPATFCKAIPATRTMIFILFSSFKTTLSKQPRNGGCGLI